MDSIKVGDRVEWKPKYRSKRTPAIMTGRVISVHGGRKPWAAVRVSEPNEGNWCVDLNRLIVIADHTPVASTATERILDTVGGHKGYWTRTDGKGVFVREDGTTVRYEPDEFADTLALHPEPYRVLDTLAEMEDVEVAMRFSGSLE